MTEFPFSILENHYNISPTKITKMAGYDNLNFRVSVGEKKYVLKIYRLGESIEFLNATDEVLDLLSDQFPKSIATVSGEKIIEIELEGEKCFAQLLTFLEGTFLGDLQTDEKLLNSFGSFLGKMNTSLLSHRSPHIEARNQNWDNQYALMNEELTPYIIDHSRRRLAEYFFQQFKEVVLPHQYKLRKSIIQADANEWNTLAQNGKVTGLIDFGDIAYSWLINELAIAISYALFGKENLVEAACQIIKTYHQQLPLEEKELEVLYYLIAIRAVVSVCNSTHQATLKPDNEYITISQKPAWDFLEKWITVNPIFAENEFRKICGFPNKTFTNVNTLLENRNKVLSESLSVSYKTPIHFEKAALQYMYATDGNTYLDAYNNIKHVGHCHPKIVNAIQRQAAKMNTNTRYIYENLTDYSAQLLKHFPEKLNKIFFVNSGSAATDAALRMARTHTQKKGMLVMEEGYHGNTSAGIEVSHYKFGHEGGEGESENIFTLPFPTDLSNKKTIHLQNESLNQNEWKTNLQLAISNAQKNGLAGFIAEPILGCAGQVPLPDGYLKMAYELVREAGGVCIADEVQIGFGRTGKFWGWEHHEVIPDMVILGKPMGNGHPIGAVVTTSEIAKSFDNGMEFFSSFGGNPVSCAIGKSVLEVIEKEDLIKNATEVGNYFKSILLQMQKDFPIIYDIRGDGLFLGIEFRRPNEVESITPTIKEELKKRYILTSTDGPGERTLKVKPPMIFSKKNVDEFVFKLKEILQKIQQFSL